VSFVRRHLLALVLVALLLAGVVFPLPPLVDAVTGAAAGNVELARPALYVVLAPLSTLLDALTFLSVERALVLVGAWSIVLAALAAWRSTGPWWRRLLYALLGPAAVVGLAAAAVLAPRPVPRLRAAGAGLGGAAITVLDYHAHSAASHDGRSGWTPQRLAAWHAVQGFDASYVTDHNVLYTLPAETMIPLLPGVEWSVHRQHVLALGPVREIDRAAYSGSTPKLLGLFAELHRQGALGIASLPEYWDNHREDLDLFVAAGVDGFEIVNCSPKGLALDGAARRNVIELAKQSNLLVVGASDHHGWGKVTCVWNLSVAGAQGLQANHVVARPVALAQGDAAAWAAPVSQLWLMFRALSWPERISWLTWIALVTIYRAVPRREGKPGGLGILFRSLTPRPRPSQPAA
jgi:hypothetical protein